MTPMNVDTARSRYALTCSAAKRFSAVGRVASVASAMALVCLLLVMLELHAVQAPRIAEQAADAAMAPRGSWNLPASEQLARPATSNSNKLPEAVTILAPSGDGWG